MNIISDEENKNDGFVLIPTKTTGNFSILKPGSTFVNPKKIYYKVYGCYVPFGIEEYNKNFLINIVITEDKNFNYNLLVSLKNMCNALIDLKNTKSGKEKYLISDKNYFSFMNLIQNNNNNNNKDDIKDIIDNNEDIKDTKDIKDIKDIKEDIKDIKEDTKDTKDTKDIKDIKEDTKDIKDKINKEDIKKDNNKYKLRLYLKKGCKILNKQNEIQQNHSSVKRKRCNMILEVGSLWVNEKTKKYGVNIYVNEIIIC